MMLIVAPVVAGIVLAFAAGGVVAAEGQIPGDPKAGETVYTRCQACHALDYDRTGPRHCGLFGRRAGSVRGFSYSEAMSRSAIIWDQETLDRFLEKPLVVVPGTTMVYAGISDKKERVDLIAYLWHSGRSSQCGK